MGLFALVVVTFIEIASLFGNRGLGVVYIFPLFDIFIKIADVFEESGLQIMDVFAFANLFIEIADALLIATFEERCLGIMVFAIVPTLLSVGSTFTNLFEWFTAREEGLVRVPSAVPIYQKRRLRVAFSMNFKRVPGVVFSVLRLCFRIAGLVHMFKGDSEADFLISLLSLGFATLEVSHWMLVRHYLTQH